MELKIIHASQADLDEIIDLRYHAFSAVAPDHYSAIEVENLLGDVDRNQLANMIANETLFCIRLNARLVGSVGWQERYLRHLYVAPNHFNGGIGKSLLEYVISDFQDRTRYNEILAGVIIYARPFYEKCGFQLLSEETAWDGSSYFMMRRCLSKPVQGSQV